MHTPWRNSQFVKNDILASLSPLDFEYIRPLLQAVPLKERAVLQEPHRPAEYVHFVETGLVSLMTLGSGSILETGMVGSQGFDPASVVLGANTPGHRAVVLFSGTALRIRSDDLRHSMQERPQIRERLLGYVQSLIVHCSQTALCGVLHQLEQRLACWLCLVCDAIDEDMLPITHDHLSTVLGFERVGVTKTLKRFEEQHLIKRMRGSLEIRDREMLQRKACCCHGIISAARRRTRAPRLVAPVIEMAHGG